MNRWLCASAILALTLTVGCKKQSEQTNQPPSSEQPSANEAAEVGQDGSNATCVGPIQTSEPQIVEVGKQKWELNGSTMTLKSPMEGELKIGAITDIKEDTEENKANLDRIVRWFKKEGVDLVVVAGDSGENREQIENVIAILAKTRVPVLNIIGNREGKTDYHQAMVSLRKAEGNVFDLNEIRRVDTPLADIVSMPGYYDRDYIHHDDGCQYTSADVSKLAELVEQADSPVVLVSHGGPRQDGPEAIDRMAEGSNVGDPELTKLIRDNEVAFGIFGNIHEAGGRATDLDGKVLETEKPHESLYLNPGPADAVRWVMNDNTISVGMAGLMTVKNGKASYSILKLEESDAPTATGKKERPEKARKL